jgi:hypothetical protein
VKDAARIAAFAVEAAVEAALGEVERQCGETLRQVCLEARGVGLHTGNTYLRALSPEWQPPGGLTRSPKKYRRGRR